AVALRRSVAGRGVLRRSQSTAVGAAFAVWFVHACLDWDWEMPALTGAALVLAASLFALAAGNHSLTLLLAAPIGLYVLAVHPGLARRPRLITACAIALVGTLVLVYLELPLRAGIFRAPLVYAKPDTWDGFWYVALAEQFRGSLHDPLGELPRKAMELIALTVTQFGFLAPLIGVGFVATVVRHPRYALLTGSAMLVTTIFNASYANADIQRYYLGPAFWAWTWLGILAGVIVEQVADLAAEAGAGVDLGGAARQPRSAAVLPALVAAVVGAVLLVPAALDFGPRAQAADRHADTSAQRWLDAALGEIEPGAVVVSWWSTSTPLWYAQYVDGLRPDLTIVDDRTRLDLGYGEATDVIARFLGSRPVYVIRANAHDLGLVLDRYDLEQMRVDPATNVYRVLGPKGAGG
ncbi:MAG: hypothetical protein ABIV26_00460, partial [Candidatus Limnocylindrales bacterium]